MTVVDGFVICVSGRNDAFGDKVVLIQRFPNSCTRIKQTPLAQTLIYQIRVLCIYDCCRWDGVGVEGRFGGWVSQISDSSSPLTVQDSKGRFVRKERKQVYNDEAYERRED